MYLPQIQIGKKIFVPAEVLQDYIGYKDISHIRKMARDKHIPAKKIGQKWYFNIDDVCEKLYGSPYLNKKSNTYRKPR